MQRYIFLFQDQGEREDFEATVLFHAPEVLSFSFFRFRPSSISLAGVTARKNKSIVSQEISNVFQKISNVFRKISNVFQKISNVFAPLAQRFSSFRCHSSK